MKVMLTGGTGFIGGHILKALLDAGHEPRIAGAEHLQVGPDVLAPTDRRHPTTHVVGDILDRASVDEALEGCDACIHAAAFTSLDPEEMPKALDVNEPGARNVLDAAIAAGCDPIVHVSTMSVIFPPTGDRLSAYDPIHGGGAPYNESKADAEVYARALQDAGKPIVIVYPAGCTAPLDLGVNVLENMLNQILAAEFVMTAESGGYLLIDTRDAGDGDRGAAATGEGTAALHDRRQLHRLGGLRRRARRSDRHGTTASLDTSVGARGDDRQGSRRHHVRHRALRRRRLAA